MDQTIIEKVREVASEVLKEEIVLENNDYDFTYASNLDSVNRVAILSQLEEEYDFIFKIREISSWNSIGELSEIIEKHIS